MPVVFNRCCTQSSLQDAGGVLMEEEAPALDLLLVQPDHERQVRKTIGNKVFDLLRHIIYQLRQVGFRIVQFSFLGVDLIVKLCMRRSLARALVTRA